MNKYLKGCLIILGVLILVILTFFGIIYYQVSTSRQRNASDDIECANTQYINEDQVFEISDSIATKNIDRVKLFVIRDSKTVDSALVVNKSTDALVMSLPFKKVKLSDSIIIQTEKNQYSIQNMTYFNDAKWGMFGYLGMNCKFSFSFEKLK